MRGRPRFDTAGAGRNVRTRRPGQGASLGEARPRTHPGVPQREGRVDRVAHRRVPEPGRARLRPLWPAGTAAVQSRFQTNRPLEGLQRSCRRLPVRRHLRALAGARKGNQVSNHSHEEAGSGRTTSPYAARIRAIEARSPANGAKLVARAWVDPDFKELLLADGKAAASKLHMDPEHPAEFIVVENTPEVHNLIVCTLCSCYPRAILGRPPDWYKSFEYRKRAVNEPRAVMREFGFEPPEGVDVVVHDSTADARYMVLPMRPSGTESMDEEELAELVTRDALVGSACRVLHPARALADGLTVPRSRRAEML